MIYGEELINIDFSSGLWLADDLDAVPDGYCANLVNLVKNGAGGFQLRPNFLPVTNFWSSINTNISSLFKHHPLSKFVNSRDATSDTGNNLAAFDLQPVASFHPYLSVFQCTSLGSVSVFWVCRDNQVTNFSYSGGLPHKIVQYRDRYYSLELSNSATSAYGQFISRYEFTVGYALTRTLLQTLPVPAIDLLCFKDRLFAFSAATSRIYYTEQATTGGYPENWNSGNNFFDLPDSGAYIKRAFVLNDRIYIFTNLGVYHLYADGSPAGWRVLSVNSTIRINFHEDVNLIDGAFVYTDRSSVYVYNGSSTNLELGKPIANALNPTVRDYAIPLETSVQTYDGPTAFKFFKYLNGFIFACYHYSSDGSGLVKSRFNKYYYFDGEVWSELQFDQDLSGANRDHYDLLLVGGPTPFTTSLTEKYSPYPYLVELRQNSNTTAITVRVKTIRPDNKDMDIINFQTVFGLFTKDYEFRNPNISRFKEGRVNFKTSLSQFTVSPYVDGVFSNTDTVALTTTGQFKRRVPINIQRGNSIAFSVAGVSNTTTAPGGDQSQYVYPAFRINSINVFSNTDTRKTVNQTYAT
jgi:hypothetical protein